MTVTGIDPYLQLVSLVKPAPGHALWSTYDPEADVLYVNFKRPRAATDSELTDDHVIIRYAGHAVIGITILHVSRR